MVTCSARQMVIGFFLSRVYPLLLTRARGTEKKFYATECESCIISLINFVFCCVFRALVRTSSHLTSMPKIMTCQLLLICSSLDVHFFGYLTLQQVRSMV